MTEVYNRCISCNKPVLDRKRIICRECAEKVIKKNARFSILLSRQCGKTFTRRILDRDLKFYAEQMIGESDD